MQNHPKLGEIILPGPARNSGIRSFILTGTIKSEQSTEMLFGILAAEAPKKLVDKLVDRLLNEARPAFFSSDAGANIRYEAMLKKANRSILAFLHEHRLSLPGIKLRGFVAALSGDTFFAASRGSLRGFLLVKKREKPAIVPLFAEGSDTSTNPKFFSSFQQGTLPSESVFVAGTKELFGAIDETFLKRVFSGRDALDAHREVRKALNNAPKVAMITLAMPSESPSAVSSTGTATVPSSVRAPLMRARKKNELPINMDVGEIGARSIEGIFVFFLRYLKLIPKLLVVLFRGLVTLLRLLAHIPRLLRTLADGNRRKAVFGNMKAMPKNFARHGFRRFNALPNRNKAHLLLLVVVSAIFVHGILFSVHRHSQALAAKAYEAKLAEIGQLQTDLETSIIIGNDRRSRDAVVHLRTLIEELPTEKASEIATKRELEDDLKAQSDKLKRYVTIADPETLVTFEDAEGTFAKGAFTWFGRALYLFSPSGSTVKSFALDGSSSEEPIDAPARIREVTPARTGILLAFEDGSVGFWKPGAPDVLLYPDISVPRSPILFYQGRLYTVTDDGMLERRGILNRSLGSATNALLSPSDIKNPFSIAADGAAYLLSNNGELRKYLKGAEVEGFRPPVIEPPPKRAKDLWASVNSRWLVFLEQDENRIIMIDSSTGRLAAQLVSPAFGNVSSMTVDANGEYAYLHSGTRILSVPLKGPGIK